MQFIIIYFTFHILDYKRNVKLNLSFLSSKNSSYALVFIFIFIENDKS